MLRRKLDSFLSTQSMQSVTVEERWKTVDLLSWLLQPRPEDRPASFDAILKHAFFDDGGAWRMSDLHKQIACDNDDVKTVLPKFTADVLNSSEHPLGSTPLHIAVIENKLHFAKQLIAQEADANKSDSTGRTPIQHLLALLQKPRSDDDRAKQLRILPMLSKATKYQSEMITETGGQGHAHASRARHLVSACDSLRDSEWGAPLAQLLLQQAAEHSWLDACERLVEKGAKLDEPSPWDPRLPRQIGMASNLPELRKFFQTYSTVCTPPNPISTSLFALTLRRAPVSFSTATFWETTSTALPVVWSSKRRTSTTGVRSWSS